MSIKCPVLPRGGGAAGGQARSEAPNELNSVLYNLQAALQAIRDLPVAPLEREQFYTLIYNLVSSANTLIVEDSIYGQPDLVADDRPSAALLSDLDLIKG